MVVASSSSANTSVLEPSLNMASSKEMMFISSMAASITLPMEVVSKRLLLGSVAVTVVGVTAFASAAVVWSAGNVAEVEGGGGNSLSPDPSFPLGSDDRCSSACNK